MTVTILAFLSGTAELGLFDPERPGTEWREDLVLPSSKQLLLPGPAPKLGIREWCRPEALGSSSCVF